MKNDGVNTMEEKNLPENIKINLVRNRKKREIGFAEFICGFLLLLVGIWLWSHTLGTRLLFTDVWIGRISRYYWGVCITAIVVLVLGFWKIKRYPKVDKAKGVEEKTDVHQELKGEERFTKANEKQICCSQCGKLNDAETKFCIFCGNKMS